MAERPDLRGHAALVGEGIVVRHAAVVVEAHDLAEVGLHVLRGIELLPLAGADPQLAVVAEQQAMAVVTASTHLRHLAPDHLEVLEPAAAVRVQCQRPARHRTAARVAVAGFGVADVHGMVVGELRVQRDVAEAALAAVIDFRHPADVADLATGDVDEFQRALFLGDQQAAVGQEGHRPRLVERSDFGGDEGLAIARAFAGHGRTGASRFAGSLSGGTARLVACGQAARGDAGDGEQTWRHGGFSGSRVDDRGHAH